VHIVAGDQQEAMLEPSREDLVWDPSIMDSVSEEEGACPSTVRQSQFLFMV